jgi:hypothetical protein
MSISDIRLISCNGYNCDKELRVVLIPRISTQSVVDLELRHNGWISVDGEHYCKRHKGKFASRGLDYLALLDN